MTPVQELDFTLELNSDYLPKETEYDLFAEAETRLKELAAGHSDLKGAAINIRRPAAKTTAPLHEVTVVVYVRPKNISATHKESDPQMALREALDAAVGQIRDKRAKLGKRWEQPGNLPPEQEIAEVVAAEAADQLTASDRSVHRDGHVES